MKENNKQNDSSRSQPRGRAKTVLSQETRSEILRLHAFYGTREIARRVGCSRKIVRRVLAEQGSLAPPELTSKASKLDPFRETIE